MTMRVFNLGIQKYHPGSFYLIYNLSYLHRLTSYCSYRFTGTGPALASNRISYAFDLRGPSVTLDTACSGSLVAVHQACQSIRSGEIRQALVGGTNLILDPEYMASMSSMQ